MTRIIASDRAGRPPQPVWAMYRAMVGLGVLCAFLLALVYLTTAPVIARKQTAYLDKAVLQVLPGAIRKRNFSHHGEGGFVATERAVGEDVVYAGYGADGGLVGVAVVAEGGGYQDVIRLLYGYRPDTRMIVGMRVLVSKETPGLGDRIESAPHFLASFTQLAAAPGAGGEGLQHAIVAVKQGQREHPWQIDGITGATISSQAVAAIVNRSAQRWVPAIAADLEDLTAEAR